MNTIVPQQLTKKMCIHPIEYREEEVMVDGFYNGKIEFCTLCGKDLSEYELKEVEPF